MPTASRRRPDREDPHGLHRDRQGEDPISRPSAVAERVDAVVERAHRPLEPQPRAGAAASAQQRPRRAGEEEERRAASVAEDEHALDPEVGADVVPAEREQEADRSEEDGRRAAERALEQDDRRRSAPSRAGWRRDVSRIRTASPPIEVGRICPAVYATK